MPKLAALQLLRPAVERSKLDLAAEQRDPGQPPVATTASKPIAALRLADLSDQGKADDPGPAWQDQQRRLQGPGGGSARRHPAKAGQSRKRAMPIRRRRMPAACRTTPNSS